MDNFREWVSDNLRYILLILAILAVVLLGFFGVRYLGNRAANPPEDEMNPETTATLPEVTETPTVMPAEDTAEEPEDRPLEEDPVEVKNLIDLYYQALSEQDVAKLGETLDVLSDDDAAKVVTSIPAVYSDVKTYVKPGPEANTHVVYAYYKYQEEGAAALPGLSSLYVVPNASGKLVIKTMELTPAEDAYLAKVSQDEDVVALVNRVKAEYEEAQKAASENAEQGAAENTQAAEGSNAEQAVGEAAEQQSTTENAEEQPAAENAEEQPVAENTEQQPAAASESDENASNAEAPTGAGRITRDCNVRSGAGYGYDPIGVISEGTEVMVIGDRSKGWIHIQGGGFDGYVGSQFVE